MRRGFESLRPAHHTPDTPLLFSKILTSKPALRSSLAACSPATPAPMIPIFLTCAGHFIFVCKEPLSLSGVNVSEHIRFMIIGNKPTMPPAVMMAVVSTMVATELVSDGINTLLKCVTRSPVVHHLDQLTSFRLISQDPTNHDVFTSGDQHVSSPPAN